MSSYYVVVADGARARFFTLDAGQPGLKSAGLVEQAALVNPEAEESGREKFSDAKSGRNTAPLQAGAHGYDDHRNRHDDEVERRFARQVAHMAVERAGAARAGHLVLAAEPRLLGMLREAITVPPASSLQLRELASNLAKLPPHEVYAHLVKEAALPGG